MTVGASVGCGSSRGGAVGFLFPVLSQADLDAFTALPGDVPSKVAFDLFMDTESGTYYDQLSVNVYVGGAKTTLWDKSASGFATGNWMTISLDLSAYIGQEITLEFYFDTVDSFGNSGFGVAVDNLHFIAACP